MASKDKTKKDTNVNTETENNTSVVAAQSSGDKPSKKALFEAYDASDKAVAEAEADLEQAVRDRSQTVGQISDLYGNGPFDWRGRIVTVVSRTTKGKTADDPETVTHFFKGNRKGVEVIE